jgi:two-component system sensor histidine kinase and response regulator WspE
VSNQDLGQLSMRELFRLEAESQTQTLTAGLLTLERMPDSNQHFEACMRAAHSLKGAARIVGIDAAVAVAHAMEDFFVASHCDRLVLQRMQIDVLLQGVDLLARIAKAPESVRWSRDMPEVVAFIANLGAALHVSADEVPTVIEAPPIVAEQDVEETESSDRFLRVTAQNLNRMLGLAGETLVESRRLRPFGESLLRLKRMQQEGSNAIETLRDALSDQNIDERADRALAQTRRCLLECQQYLAERLQDIELFDRHLTGVAHRLYDEALACRMRPFADGVRAFPRMVRDLAHSLGKQARLEIIGAGTPVDRDVLEKLEAPLAHLLRNAIDHGISTPAERIAAGKPAEGVVRLEASHSAGLLCVAVSDDGEGVAFDRVRSSIIDRGLIDADTVLALSETELLEFLFLPGFSVKEEVTEISGRGVGLDAVQGMARQLRGSVRAFSTARQGTRFQLNLPLTISVIDALLVEVGGEPYAFPLAHVSSVLALPRDAIEHIEGNQHFRHEGQQVALVSAQQVFDAGTPQTTGEILSVLLVGDFTERYGLIVERFLGARELVVHPLDPCLGKIQDISAGALLEDGAPLLIVDVEDVLRSVHKMIKLGELRQIQFGADHASGVRRKRVLVVDDSLTVRELERKLLDSNGYDVEVAVDGVDGWNAVRSSHFHLVVTDVDMPRMDGIELVRLIRRDPKLQSLPVMIVSYKDRDEDRQRGLDAGADFYLAKGTFHDESLLQAVIDLIGGAPR